MVVSQHPNGGDDILYGCYLTGRSWFFLVLKGREYTLSNTYNATEEDVYQIVAILRKIKTLFEHKINYVAQ